MLHELLRNGAAASLMMALALGCEESPAIAGKTLASLISSVTPLAPSTPGVVSGVALDTRGKPIAGAKIWVRPALTTGLLETMTDANGRYEVQGIARIPYRAYAWHQLQYRGKKLCLRLASENPGDYDPFVPKEGVTRNFRWQLSGDIAPFSEDKFGADLRVFPPPVPAGSKVVVTLIPDGPLVDGSTGETLNIDMDEVLLTGIPVGVYKASAAIIAADGARTPLELRRDTEPYAMSVSVQWQTKGSCVGSTASGPDRAYLWMRIPGEE